MLSKEEGIDVFIAGEGYSVNDLAYMRKYAAKLNGFLEVKNYLSQCLKDYKVFKRENPSGTMTEIMGFIDGKVSTFFCGKNKETYLVELEKLLSMNPKEGEVLEKVSEGLRICVYGASSNAIRSALEVAQYVLKYKNKEEKKEIVPEEVRDLYEIL